MVKLRVQLYYAMRGEYTTFNETSVGGFDFLKARPMGQDTMVCVLVVFSFSHYYSFVADGFNRSRNTPGTYDILPVIAPGERCRTVYHASL
jgi:hypothetical protein